MAHKVLISDKMSARAQEILKDSGIEVDVKTGLSPKDIKEIIGGRLTGKFDLYDYRKTDAQYYHIVGIGEVKGVTAGVEAVIKKATKGVEVLSWRED